jgi:hypothetical protein
MNAAQFYPGFPEGGTLPLRNLEGGGFLSFGNFFYVDSVTGSDSANNGSTFNNALATIDAAIGYCTANKGDVIVVRQGHSETVTAAITADIAGVKIVGLGEGNQRPAITGNGTIDAINVTAAGVIIENLRFPAPSTDDQTADINVAGAGCVIRNTYHIGSQTSKNKTDIITVASGGDDLIVENVRAYNTVVDCVSWLSLEAAVARPVIRGCKIQGTFSTGVLMDEATATLALIEHNIFKNTKAATAVVTFTTGNTTGVMSENKCSGRHTTIASNIVPGTGMDFFENYTVEEAALNGLYIPAQDAD